MSGLKIERVKEWCTQIRTFANYTPNLETYNQNCQNLVNVKLNLPTIDNFIENLILTNTEWESDIGYACVIISSYVTYFRPYLMLLFSGQISYMITILNVVPSTTINIEEEAKLSSVLKKITSEYHIQKLFFDLFTIGEQYYSTLKFAPSSGAMLKTKCSKNDKIVIEAGVAAMEKKYSGQETANGLFTRLSLDSTRDVYDRLYEAYIKLPGCYKLKNDNNKIGTEKQ